MKSQRILIWLPSPLGDAVMSTPALRAIRQKYKDAEICFLGNAPVKAVLSDGIFNDQWIKAAGGPFALAVRLRKADFTDAILFKNSFSCALAVFLAGIKKRIGYGRDRRSWLLTDSITPQKNPDGTFRPAPMVDYYLKIAETLGCEIQNRNLELSVNREAASTADLRIKNIISAEGPVVILVPGGAFGPSKCWPAERYGETANLLKEKYNAQVLVSVAPNEEELKTAKAICSIAAEAVNLGEFKLPLGQLKAVFAACDLMITNDTGPRHIAIALQRKLITLFGPNDPQWTHTSYQDEIQIVGTADCLPCEKPHCFQKNHICMESITVDKVMENVEKLIGKGCV
ncbi:MAG: lipopolysaccharide heptosyltransferase II [Planctomycetes bacterium]|nr:lipopolysaccharide heptosyltransferase II [Planctomycetota bacterium]